MGLRAICSDAFNSELSSQIPADARSDAIIENIDFPVTLLDFAGCSAPDYMQGSSFRSILQSGKEPNDWKRAAYYQYWMHMAHHDVPGHIAMRTKRYKLIQFYGTGSLVIDQTDHVRVRLQVGSCMT